MSRVLVVDDDAAVCFALERFLSSAGHVVGVAPDAERGIARVRAETWDLVLLDLRLPGMSGQQALGELRVIRPALPVVVFTAHGSAETAMDALAAGAVDHLTKPVELAELRRVVEKALARAQVAPPAEAAAPSADAVVGRSQAMLDVGKRIGILARSDATVLVRGEPGTGKEHVARAIHERSARHGGPFVPIACAALSEDAFEAELFGAAKSAGGDQGRNKGSLGVVGATARGGTVFLDEIGAISLTAQVKLLRALEEGPLGPSAATPARPSPAPAQGADVRRTAELRVIAATTVDLETRVKEGRFREDLYYRLNVVTIELPPLRDRREDIPLLVEHFLARASALRLAVEPEALGRLVAAPWPGNVRELRSAVEHAVALAGGGPIAVEHVPATVLQDPGRSGDALDALGALVARIVARHAGTDDLHDAIIRTAERASVEKALEMTQGNQVAAARLLGMNRTTFRKRMEEHGLK